MKSITAALMIEFALLLAPGAQAQSPATPTTLYAATPGGSLTW